MLKRFLVTDISNGLKDGVAVYVKASEPENAARNGAKKLAIRGNVLKREGCEYVVGQNVKGYIRRGITSFVPWGRVAVEEVQDVPAAPAAVPAERDEPRYRLLVDNGEWFTVPVDQVSRFVELVEASGGSWSSGQDHESPKALAAAAEFAREFDQYHINDLVNLTFERPMEVQA